MGRLLSFVAGRPARLLLVVWASALAVYALGLVRYNTPPQLSTWLFVAACIVAFCVGTWAASFSLHGRSSALQSPRRVEPDRWVEQVVRWTAALGLLGAACIAIDKLLLSGLDFSQGVTAVRFSREAAVSAGTAGDLRRSPLLYVGYVTFAFSVASYLIYILKGEILRRSTVVIAFVGLASIFSFSYIYGGRSPLGLVIGVVAGAIVVRLLSGQSFLPRDTAGRLLFVGFLALTLVYNNWILSERFVATGTSDYSTLERRFETTYDATIALPSPAPTSVASPPLVTAPVTGGTPSTSEQAQMQIVVNYYYATHELPMLERTLSYDGSLGPYYGAYQFYLAAALLERVTPWNVDAVMIPQLKAANVYGWFSTAWGGMYLDFGLVGALVAIFVCGWLAGRVYRRALLEGDDGARLLMCYVVAGIIATPVLSIFTISISLPILVALVLTASLLRPNESWAVRGWNRLARSVLPHAPHA